MYIQTELLDYSKKEFAQMAYELAVRSYGEHDPSLLTFPPPQLFGNGVGATERVNRYIDNKETLVCI